MNRPELLEASWQLISTSRTIFRSWIKFAKCPEHSTCHPMEVLIYCKPNSIVLPIMKKNGPLKLVGLNIPDEITGNFIRHFGDNLPEHISRVVIEFESTREAELLARAFEYYLVKDCDMDVEVICDR